MLRWWPAAAVLALIALIHGYALKELWLGGRDTEADGRGLRVASANVLRSNPDQDAVVAFAREAEADLLVLVEAENSDWRAALGDYLLCGGARPTRVERATRLLDSGLLGFHVDLYIDPPEELARAVRDLADAVHALAG